MELLSDRVASPIGEIVVVCDDESLCAPEFTDNKDRMMALLKKCCGDFRLVEKPNPAGISASILAYFDGALDAVADLPADGSGTAFQR